MDCAEFGVWLPPVTYYQTRGMLIVPTFLKMGLIKNDRLSFLGSVLLLA